MFIGPSILWFISKYFFFYGVKNICSYFSAVARRWRTKQVVPWETFCSSLSCSSFSVFVFNSVGKTDVWSLIHLQALSPENHTQAWCKAHTTATTTGKPYPQRRVICKCIKDSTEWKLEHWCTVIYLVALSWSLTQFGCYCWTRTEKGVCSFSMFVYFSKMT